MIGPFSASPIRLSSLTMARRRILAIVKSDTHPRKGVTKWT